MVEPDRGCQTQSRTHRARRSRRRRPGCGVMTMTHIDRRAIRVILALCDMDLSDFAKCLGYDRGYVSNVLTGSTPPSPAFCRAFGDTIAGLVFGERCRSGRMLPAGPLVELVRRRARYAPRKRDFYSDNGINMKYLCSRDLISEVVVDRICSSLGVHPLAIYRPQGGAEEASWPKFPGN